jgi:hypothetical protein
MHEMDRGDRQKRKPTASNELAAPLRMVQVVKTDQRSRNVRSRPAASWYRASVAVRLCRVFLLASAAYTCFGLNVYAQTSDSQTPAESSKSWTATTDSTSDNLIPTRVPTRIIESHSQNSTQTLDKRSVQIRGSDGHFEPYQEIEKETLQLDVTTMRTTIRTFGRDVNGAKTLVQVTEEERHTLPSGDSHVVRITSDPDVNGRLQPVQREVVETKKVGTDNEETNTAVMLPSPNGGLAPAFKTHEVRKEDANQTMESEKTTLLPDVNGNWQVSEIRTDVTRQEANHRISEERVSRLDAEGKLGEVSRVVSEESDSAAGDKRNVVETYSVDVPGTTRDGSLHLLQRATTAQRTSASGERVTEQTVEQINPGDPGTGLRVSILVDDALISGPSGEQSTLTIRARDSNGNLGVVSVDTSKSDWVTTIQFQPIPSSTSR